MESALSFDTLGALVGGLGLFLLAVGMISDGLRLAAGDALKELLGRWTSTPLRGIASGALITGVVQSSSAVTVATIGFVNANLLTLHQALGVVYGANIGTTMTGWLVAAVGFKIKVEAFALPLIGIGMALRLSGSRSRRGALGEALAGFGLFFIGIDFLRGAFEGLAQVVDLSAIPSGSVVGLLLFVGIGFFMTLVTQSSSAAIAITLTAATGGLVDLAAAAAMVIGANVGTTSTAVLATLGATANARRVASAHVVFNVLTGAVALALLPIMLWLVSQTSRLLALDAAPAVALAVFHTLFNVLGVLLLWPLTGRLSQWLGQRFATAEELLGKPRYLDATTAGTPALALEAMRLELRRMIGMTRDAALLTMQKEVDRARLERLQGSIATLLDCVETAVSKLELQRLTAALAVELTDVLRAAHELRDALAHTRSAALVTLAGDDGSVGAFQRASIQVLSGVKSMPAAPDTEIDLKPLARLAREALLQAAVAGRITTGEVHARLEQVRATRQMIEHLRKAADRLGERTQADALGATA
ncbi:Na/Pi symporter [Algiphilus sp.]|uniref:Na/Pi cotransporter family protein n=1 Tax=Algiphilus sp. TaxID=1872431 RepID=UPI003B51FDD7